MLNHFTGTLDISTAIVTDVRDATSAGNKLGLALGLGLGLGLGLTLWPFGQTGGSRGTVSKPILCHCICSNYGHMNV